MFVLHFLEISEHEDSVTFCSCGKNKSRGNQPSCQQLKDNNKSGCPCVKKKLSCTRKCKCRNCQNQSNSTAKTPPPHLVSCRCGESAAYKKGLNIVSCKDVEKKSKCPCLGSGQGCSHLCKCHNCDNMHGARSVAQAQSPGCPRKRKRGDQQYKRAKSCNFLASAGFAPLSGPWTNFECSLLATVINVLSLTLIAPTAKNIAQLFNYVTDSSHAQETSFKPSNKTINQIAAKLAHLERKVAVSNARSCS